MFELNIDQGEIYCSVQLSKKSDEELEEWLSTHPLEKSRKLFQGAARGPVNNEALEEAKTQFEFVFKLVFFLFWPLVLNKDDIAKLQDRATLAIISFSYFNPLIVLPLCPSQGMVGRLRFGRALP